MENEKIFVVVPVYKVEAYLERCVDSILNQTYQNYELILVDDGSPDNCPAICDRYAAEHENITVIHQENGGLSAARNTGIEYALKQGDHNRDWISFVDSDDFVHPKYLEYLHQAVKETGAQISCCGYYRTDCFSIVSVSDRIHFDNLSPEEIWCRDYTNANVVWGKLYQLALINGVYFPIGKTYEDTYTTYKLLFQLGTIAVTKAKLYYWYINNASITMSEWTPKQIDQVDAAESQLPYLKANGYRKASRRSARHMLWGCVKCLKYIRRLSPKYDHLLVQMEDRQKQAFRLYAKEAGLVTACCYWLMVRYIAPAGRRFKRKLRKILHH